ncbi:MAG TPA: PilZN3 domain-containing protein, partial [Rectinemataceae bacterium]|nr:PilZN3 domain-containing protein [Rectinemataceae bacterium]
MQKQATLSYAEQFKDSVISCSPFVLRSTGIIQTQTSLKVDTYSLACVPYQLSMARAILLGALSKEEIAFFQKFKSTLAGLSLTVQPANAREPAKIFCRCQISGLGMMKGRDHVGLVVCDFKPIPPSLETILGDHMMQLERLHAERKDLQGKLVPVNPE